MNSFLEPPPDTRKGQLDGCSIKVSAYEAAETPPHRAAGGRGVFFSPNRR